MNIASFIYPVGLPIALSLTAYNAFLTGLIVLLKRRDESGLRYFITSFTIFVWGVGISFMLNNDLPEHICKWWGTFAQEVAIFIAPTWLHFVMVYTNKEKQFQKLLYSIYAISFIIFGFSFSSHFVIGYRNIVSIKFYPIPGLVYDAFAIIFAVVTVFSFLVFYLGIQEAASYQKRDLKWVCFASLYGFAMGSITFFPIFGIPVPQYNLLLMPLWQILLAYAMIRYRMFDLEEVAQAAHRDKLAAIGTLATSINHEIRNPLYVIQGLAESYLENLNDKIYSTESAALEKSREILRKTADQATRAMDIMKRFAVFAKQGIDQTVHVEQVSLYEVMEDIIPLVRHEIQLDKIEFETNISQSLPTIKADRRHIEQILFNLIVNACQAFKNSDEVLIRKASAWIQLSAHQNNGHINALIKDNGPGILPHQLSRIFEPFYTTKEEGTGLGLYVTKQLVERNNGKISVESKLGEGTKFILTLPTK